MSPRTAALALTSVVTAVLVQTTLFADLRPFGAAPNLVVVVVIITVLHLDPEPGILLGFTAGILMDVLGLSPLGMWALVMTVVAHVTIRLRERAADSLPLAALALVVVSFGAELLFAMLGTLFGERTLSDPTLFRTIVLVSLYNAVLAVAVYPAMRFMMRSRRPRSVVL